MVSVHTGSGLLLQIVARSEAVHRVRSLAALKKRLSNGKRCYALVHPSFPSAPTAFIHIALSEDVASSMRFVEACEKDPEVNTNSLQLLAMPNTASN